jgi:hypothetical protein
MHHLGVAHGFNTTIGSFQTGGPYSGPKHTLRWENDHPIYADSQFTNMPGPDARRGGRSCNVSAPDEEGAEGEVSGCNATIYHNSNLQCGHAIEKVAAPSADACCASCAATPGCDHWVFHPWENITACHVKGSLGECGPADETGSTAGIMKGGGTPPGPSPASGPAVCTNEYSTDLWGALALQAVEQVGRLLRPFARPFWLRFPYATPVLVTKL